MAPLNAPAYTATAGVLAGHPGTPQLIAQATGHGYTTAFRASAALLAAGRSSAAPCSGAPLATGSPAGGQESTRSAEHAVIREPPASCWESCQYLEQQALPASGGLRLA